MTIEQIFRDLHKLSEQTSNSKPNEAKVRTVKKRK